MQATIRTVNDIGLREIRDFLDANDRKGAEWLREKGYSYFDDEMLRAWARSAEYQEQHGNGPTIELRATDSIHGWTQDYTISDAGMDAEIVEIDE